MEFFLSKLLNGATFLKSPVTSTQSTTVLVMFPVGSRYETPELNGVSHFIEHMMFKGTEKRPSTQILSRELDALGAEYNAYTSKDYTGYYIHLDAKYIDTALDIVSDMLWNSLFDAQELEREKGVIAEELHMYEDNPLMHIGEMLEEKVFSGSPLGWKIGGTDKIISAFKRNHLVGFRDRFYTPDKMCVVVSGNIPADIDEKVEQFFGFAKRDSNDNVSFIPHVYSEQSNKTLLKWKETEQAVTAIGFPAFSYTDKRLQSLNVLNIILGGTMSSRLFIEVRERRGLAYMVHSDVSPYHETGMFSIQMGLLPTRVEEALKTVREEINKIITSGVTDIELAQAKTHIRGRMTLALENSSAVAEWFGKQYVLKQEADTPEERLAKIEAVTKEDVLDVAKDVFVNDSMRLAVIGPFKNAEIFENLLK